MNENVESAKAAFEYIKAVNDDKKAEIKAYDIKLFAMMIISGLLLLGESMALTVLVPVGRLYFVFAFVGIALSVSSIVILIVAFWDNRKESYSSKLNRDLFDTNDLSVFYRDQLNNMKINFVFLDKTLTKKKSLLFSSSVCLFGVAVSVIASVIFFLIKII